MGCPCEEPLDPRARRTRTLLQDAMRQLVHEKPLREITVQDITERATVNRATFYAHYSDKDALLANVLQVDFQHFMRQRFEEFPAFDAKGLHTVVAGVVEFVGAKYTTCPASIRDSEHVISTTLQEEIRDMLKFWLGKEESSYLEEHSAEMVATVFSWGIYGAAHRWSRSQRKRTPQEIATSVVGILMKA